MAKTQDLERIVGEIPKTTAINMYAVNKEIKSMFTNTGKVPGVSVKQKGTKFRNFWNKLKLKF